MLLVGDISKAFLDAGSVADKHCEVYANMLDAIDAAAKNNLAIAIVMFGISAKLSSALKTLKEVNSEAKIILLAQMYEEPIAVRLVGSAYNGTSVADDYLICPVPFSYLASRISYLVNKDHRAVSTSEWETQYAIRNTQYEKIKQLERLATEDDLTGLKNRRYIWEFSRQIIEHAGKVRTLLVFDIDNLKHYNDVYGHSAGDEVLKQAAVLIRRCCREHDVVGRIGGDEFAVVFWDDPQRKTPGTPRTAMVQGVPAKGAERRSARADHPKEAIFIAKRFVRELEKAELAPRFVREQVDNMGTQLHLLGPEGKGVLTISGGLASFPYRNFFSRQTRHC
jgi:GGDEF domain-containing protein